MVGIQFLVIFLLIVLNGLLAMSELAVVSARKSRLQHRADAGSAGARVALALANTPDRFLSTVQIGITLIGVGTGALGGATLSGPVGGWLSRIPGIGDRIGNSIAGVIVVIGITYLSLVIGELVPKRIALQQPETMAMLMSRPLQRIALVTAPVVTLLAWSSDLVLRLLGRQQIEQPAVTEEEVNQMLGEAREAGVFDYAETEMVAGIFNIGDRTAGELMTPRHRVVFLDVTDPPDDNRKLLEETAHSHYPVVEGSTDNVIGMVATRDLWLRSLHNEPLDLRATMHDAYFVPEIAPVLTVIGQMRAMGTRDAIVVDEYGGVTGLITMTDVLSDIVGEFGEPTNTGIKGSTRRADGSWLLDGNFPAHETRELLDIGELPGEEEGNFETLGGFVMEQLGHIPHEGEAVDVEGYRVEVMDMDGNRIDKLLVKQEPDDGAVEADDAGSEA